MLPSHPMLTQLRMQAAPLPDGPPAACGRILLGEPCLVVKRPPGAALAPARAMPAGQLWVVFNETGQPITLAPPPGCRFLGLDDDGAASLGAGSAAMMQQMGQGLYLLVVLGAV